MKSKIGYKEEISKLGRFLKSPKWAFVAIYGCRHVGKSYLVDCFSKHPFRNHPPLARLKFAEGDISNLHPDEAQCREAHGCCHVPHLPVFAFEEGEAHPTGWDGSTITDGWHSLP